MSTIIENILPPAADASLLAAASLYPDDPRLLLTRVFFVRGLLTERTVEQSLNKIVRDFPVLRCVFSLNGARAGLQMRELHECDVMVSAIESSPGQALAAKIREISSAPLDIFKAPMIDGTLIQLDELQHVLVLRIHHLIADLTTARRLVYEFFADLSSMAEPKAIGQCHRLVEQNISSTLATAHSQVASSIGEFPVDLIAACEGLARRWRVPVQDLTAAAWATTVARLRDENEISVGVYESTRTRTNLKTAGAFVRLREVGLKIVENDRLSDLSGVLAATPTPPEVQEQISPRSDIVFGFQKSSRRQSEFDAAFALGARSEAHRFGNLEVQTLCTPETALDAAYKLCIAPYELGRRWRFRFDVETEASGSSELCADLIRDQFYRILSSAVKAPDTPALHLEMLTPPKAQPKAPHGAGALPHETISDLSENHPDRIAIDTGRRKQSYQKLHAAAAEFADELHAIGLGPGDRIGIVTEVDELAIAALVGSLKANIAFVPVPVDAPRAYIKSMFERCEVSAIFASRAVIDRLQMPELRCLESKRSGPPTPRPRSPSASPSDIAYIMHTSGSSGRPKGVEITRSNLAYFLSAIQTVLPVDKTARVMVLQPLSFDISLLEILLPFSLGATAVLAGEAARRDPTALAAAISKHEPTLVQATPTIWQILAASGWLPSPAVTYLCGGEALPRSLASHFIEAGASLWNMYGPTEATIWSSCGPVEDAARITLGTPLPGTSHEVMSRNGEVTPLGGIGTLWISGPGVALGYAHDPAATAETFEAKQTKGVIERRYRTGDLVQVGGDGVLLYKSRADDQLKIAGHRVDLNGVRKALSEATGATDVLVEPVALGEVGTQIAAFFIGVENSSEAEIRGVIATQLLPSHMPGFIRFLDAPPLTPSGKVDRAALRKQLELSATQEYSNAVQSGCDIVKSIARCWKAVTGRAPTGLDVHFFASGGSSLQMIQLAQRVSKAHGVNVAPALLWRAPTLRGMADTIRSWALSSCSDGAFTAVETPPQYPPTPEQRDIWTAHHLADSPSQFKIPLLFTLEGSLDRHHVQEAIEGLVRRHPVLASAFELKEGALIASIRQPTRPEVVEIAARDEGHSVDLLERFVEQPIDLALDPLLGALILSRVGGERYLLIWFHHLIIDGSSLPILLGDFRRYLAAARSGASLEIAPDPAFALHAIRLDRLATKASGITSRPSPYAERFVPTDLVGESASVATQSECFFSEAQSNALRSFAANHCLTVYSLLAGLTIASVAKVLCRNELGVAIDVAVRPAAADAVGMFVKEIGALVNVERDDDVLKAAGTMQSLTGAAIDGFGLERPVKPRDCAIKISDAPFPIAAVRIDDALTLHPQPLLLAGPRHKLTAHLFCSGDAIGLLAMSTDQIIGRPVSRLLVECFAEKIRDIYS